MVGVLIIHEVDMRQRFCIECGTVFDACDEDDRHCKSCLLKLYRSLCEWVKG